MKDELERLQAYLKWIPRFMHPWLEQKIRSVPGFHEKIQQEDEKLRDILEKSLKPYDQLFERHQRLPRVGVPKDQVLKEIQEMSERESPRWQQGFVSGAIYHGGQEHIEFLNRVYALESQSNPLHSDLFPSITKFEAEIVSMIAGFLGSEAAPGVCGTVTSGGTESILLAMKTYRDRARRLRSIKKPEIVLAPTAHAAFDKAADYFGIRLIRVPLDSGYRMDVNLVEKAIGRNTIALVGSAPAFPHGVLDPIPELSEIASRKNVPLHVDACLGGFVIPFAERLGHRVPVVDFRNQGVTSISVDTHKYGYAAKGTSVLLYRNDELRREQFFTATDWPGGLYFSPTLAGSRPGALSAMCWAAMLSMGESGYLEAARSILDAAHRIKDGISAIPGLRVLGDPLFVIAFAGEGINIFEVMDEMNHRNWSLNGLHRPDCLHLAVTLRHAESGVVERFLSDLRDSVEAVRKSPGRSGGMAPVYGMASQIAFRGMVSDLLKKVLEVLYRP